MLSNIPVTWRMIVSALLPTLALVFFAASLVINQWSLARDMAAVEDATRFTRSISELVHQLQRERGRSAGFVGSQGGDTYRRALQTQRDETDSALSQYRTARTTAAASLNQPHLEDVLHQVDEHLAQLVTHRQRIDGLNLNLGQAVGPYTQTISAMLESVAELSHLGKSSDLSSQMIGLLNLMSAKESAGIERAVGSNIFASRSVTPDRHQLALNLMARQTAFFTEFRELMGADWAQRLDTLLEQPEALAVDTARENLIAAGYGDALSNLTGSDWFELTTQRIELLMQLEEVLAQDIISNAATLRLQARNTALTTLALTIVIALIALFGTAALMWSVVRPLAAITACLGKLAGGDTSVVITGAERGDEIGVLARTAESFRKATHEREQAVQERAGMEQAAMRERRKVLSEMATRVEAATLESVGSVADAAQSLKSNSDTIRSTLESAGRTADQVTQATEQNVKHTGRAAELASELSAAIGEVTQQITRGDALARNAMGEADRSRQSVEELNEAAQQISDFIGMITDIAEQTNLLALNATIEAARAGDAGKGFAVVASEVKALAAQTNQSTTQIAERVAQIQNRTQSTVEAMNAISQSIENIGEVTASVAAAMEEQSASTGSLSSFVDQNREALTRVSSDISELVEMTTRSAKDAEGMAGLVQTMATTASEASTAIPEIVQQAVAAAESRREQRQSVQHNAELMVGDKRMTITLIDASKQGVRIACNDLTEGQIVKLTSPPLDDLATVIWASGGEVGLSFAEPLCENALKVLLDAGARAIAA
ncbi:Chemotaxis protein (Tlpb) [Oceanicaulis sp. 350]|nr:Chemotaxis protein (Tlpb) [Oceanicaulis sp. 350]